MSAGGTAAPPIGAPTTAKVSASTGIRAVPIAYVLSLFPCYDETFILREMKALRERGIEFRILSLKHRRDPIVQPDAASFLPRTRYAAYLLSFEVVAAVVWAMARRGREVMSVLWRLARETWRRPFTLAKSLALVPKACLFARICREEGVQHVHAHWASYPATVALLVSRISDQTWSFTCHAHDIFLDPSLLELKLESASFALTCTAFNKRHLTQLSPWADQKVRVSYHGLDLEKFRPGGQHNAGRAELLAVGSLLPCKGFDILLTAARRLVDLGLSFRLRIAGGGPEEPALRAQIEHLGLEHCVELLGYLAQDELLPLYQKADVFALPAVLEIHWGIPNVLVEALACAVPVVTTRLPSVKELVTEGENGLLVRNRDPDDLADALASLVRDPRARRDMGRAGRARVEEQFDIKRTIDSVIEPLAGMLGDPPAQNRGDGTGRR